MSSRWAGRLRSRALGCVAAASLGSLVLAGTTPAAATTTTSETVGGAALASPGLVVDSPGSTPLPKVRAAAWLLADLDTGEVLAAQDPHGRWRPASTLKVLTALTLMPKLDPTTTYRAQWEDANAEGSRAGIVPDATYTVDQLWQALFLVSGNDAASALANAAGGRRATVAAMQQTAHDVGALDTTVRNPSGLDADGQLTSAYDLAVIARAAMARQDFRTYVTTVKAQFPGKMPRAGKVRKTFEIYTQDRLLLNYRGAIGIKTGWTTKARGTFVGAASRGGHTLVATVLHSDLDSWRDSAALLSWGFRNRSVARPVGTLDALARPAGSEAGPASGTSARGTGGTSSAAPSAEPDEAGLGLPWWLDAGLLLVALVALLRARVLLRRRRRRTLALRRPGSVVRLPQSRDPRRLRTPASPAPTAAPSAMPRSVRILPGDPPDEPAVEGTGS
jgi:D-alanyl-D-alanine carboxypeptidase (penicillin-binding protein 5/6)